MKNNSSRKLLITTMTIVFLTLLSGFVINLLTGNREFADLLDSLHIQMKHLIIGTIVVAVALIFLAYLQFRYAENAGEQKEVFTGNIEPDVKRFFDSLKFGLPEVKPTFFQRILGYLFGFNKTRQVRKGRYQKRYDSKLDGRFEITLEVSDDFDKNPRQITEEFGENASKGIAVEVIREAFEKKGRLLIVGNPGVGKTVLLLKLAIDLLDKITDLENEPFPVIFNFSSWSDSYEDFGSWLNSMLVSGYGLSEPFAETLLRQERIIFLLDGLDELGRNETPEFASEQRAKCLVLLNDYLRGGRKAVICCRVEEFLVMKKQQKQDAPVEAKVRVLNLTKEQILESLESAANDTNIKHHAPARNLLEVLKKGDDDLLEALRTPFYFTTAMEVYDQTVLAEKNLAGTIDETKTSLIDKFVKRRLGSISNPHKFKHKNTVIWLRWLAVFLEKNKKNNFELADIQPSDLSRQNSYNWTNAIIFSIFNVVNWAIFGIIVGELTFRGMLFNLVLALLIGFYIESRIETHDFTRWSLAPFRTWQSIRHLSFVTFKYSLSMAILSCSIFSASYLVLGGLMANIFDSVKGVAIFGFIIGIIAGTLLSLYYDCQEVTKFANVENSYQRLKAGFFTQTIIYGAIFAGLFGSLQIIHIYIHDHGADANEMLRLFQVCYIGGVVGVYLQPLFKHLILRYCFYLEGVMPMKYATFLDYAADLRILEKDGGHWRFRHQNLQEYFANPTVSDKR